MSNTITDHVKVLSYKQLLKFQAEKIDNYENTCRLKKISINDDICIELFNNISELYDINKDDFYYIESDHKLYRSYYFMCDMFIDKFMENPTEEKFFIFSKTFEYLADYLHEVSNIFR